ncbi:MAG: aminopeptidase [Tissierellia bacterium]|nr:aminopeptidase [Tissierellia bacterium]
MENFERKLDEYARLIVNFGANVQKGKPVRISAPIEAQDFVRKLVKYSYERDASEVIVKWSDEYVTKARLVNADEDVLKTVHDFFVEELEYYYKEGVTVINVYAEDPGLLKDVDSNRIKMANEARLKAIKHLMKYTMNDIVSWLVVSIPTVDWAKKVFPDATNEEAVEKLWSDIFTFVRVTDDGDAVEEWEEHLKTLNRRAKILNEKQFKKLIYKSDNGTNLEVGLPDGHIWGEAFSTNAQGVKFIPNMPTEEIFTAPDRNNINGKLKSTLPLSYNGVLIDGMEFDFKDGKVIKYSSEKGEESLKMLLEMDEGAKYLGEVALVPHDSPISNTKRIYFNTLFDENASCHFAFGKAYPTTIKNGENLSEEELLKAGINDSMVHEDFMVGSDSLSIIGIEEDGSEFVIFEKGNFVF